MGGYGSGRWHWHDKATTVEESLGLPTTHVRKGLNAIADGQSTPWWGSLQWSIRGRVTNSIGYTITSRVGVPLVRLQYTTTRAGGEKVENDYTVLAVSTVPNYGGRRWWWICPLTGNGRACRRRVGKLYLPPGGLYFGCRHCYELTYTSSQESDKRISRLANDPMALYQAMSRGIEDAGEDTLASTGKLLLVLKAHAKREDRMKRKAR